MVILHVETSNNAKIMRGMDCSYSKNKSIFFQRSCLYGGVDNTGNVQSFIDKSELTPKDSGIHVPTPHADHC